MCVLNAPRRDAGTSVTRPMFWSSGYRRIASTDSAHLSKSAADVFGLPETKALAFTTRSSSCWIASVRVEAISAEARWKASRALSAFERATARAPSTDASAPASTSKAATAAKVLLRRKRTSAVGPDREPGVGLGASLADMRPRLRLYDARMSSSQD